MSYPPHVPEHIRFAVGHKDFGLLPGLFMYATIWMREHNRVCDILKAEHSEWDDERLFQTTKLVILGKIVFVFNSFSANGNIELFANNADSGETARKSALFGYEL